MLATPVLSFVVPCYNEEGCIVDSLRQLNDKREQLVRVGLIDKTSSILLVDDGSKDSTWSKILELKEQYSFIKALKLSTNFGHQNALLAGLMQAKSDSDCVISIDADLQDDLEVLDEFIKKFRAGYEIVYGVRNDRHADSWFKKHSAQLFYHAMQICGANIIYNHADYRLTSKKVLEALSQFGERDLFLRGIFPALGFKSTIVNYSRKKRTAGESKYSLKKMLAFSWSGITSFSLVPLRLIALLGLVFFILSFVLGVYLVYELVRTQHIFPAWSYVLLAVGLLGGIQLLCLGILGEYLGRSYLEAKARPRYLIETEVD